MKTIGQFFVVISCEIDCVSFKSIFYVFHVSLLKTIVTLSAKSSLILVENETVFCREGPKHYSVCYPVTSPVLWD